MLTEAIAAVLKYTQYAVKGCPAAREKLHNAAALAGASYGNIVDEVTPRLPYFPTEKEVSINDNDVRCAELAERLGFDSCRPVRRLPGCKPDKCHIRRRADPARRRFALNLTEKAYTNSR